MLVSKQGESVVQQVLDIGISRHCQFDPPSSGDRRTGRWMDEIYMLPVTSGIVKFREGDCAGPLLIWNRIVWPVVLRRPGIGEFRSVEHRVGIYCDYCALVDQLLCPMKYLAIVQGNNRSNVSFTITSYRYIHRSATKLYIWFSGYSTPEKYDQRATIHQVSPQTLEIIVSTLH